MISKTSDEGEDSRVYGQLLLVLLCLNFCAPLRVDVKETPAWTQLKLSRWPLRSWRFHRWQSCRLCLAWTCLQYSRFLQRTAHQLLPFNSVNTIGHKLLGHTVQPPPNKTLFWKVWPCWTWIWMLTLNILGCATCSSLMNRLTSKINDQWLHSIRVFTSSGL